MRGKEEEIVELMDERKLDILGLCETRLKGSNDRLIHNNYRLVNSGDDESSSGVGLALSAEIAPMVERVRQMNNRIINVDLSMRSGGINMVQVYTPQQGRPTREKEAFYEQLQECIDTAKYRGRLILCGDMNGHIGQDRAGYERVIGHHVIGGRNAEGLRILDFANLNHMSIMNTFYQHQPSHNWTWYRFNYEQQRYTNHSLIDLFLTSDRGIFCDVKAVPSVSLDSDHRLLLAILKLSKPKKKTKMIKEMYKLEKLKDHEVVTQFRETFSEKIANRNEEGLDDWASFKNSITEAAEESIGIRIANVRRKEEINSLVDGAGERSSKNKY